MRNLYQRKRSDSYGNSSCNNRTVHLVHHSHKAYHLSDESRWIRRAAASLVWCICRGRHVLSVGLSGCWIFRKSLWSRKQKNLLFEYLAAGICNRRRWRFPDSSSCSNPCRRQQCIRFAVSVLQHPQGQVCDCRAAISLCRRRRSRNIGNCSERYGNRFAGNLAVWCPAGTGYADSLRFHPESWHNADYIDKGS